MKFKSIRNKWLTAFAVSLVGVMVFVIACGSDEVTTPAPAAAPAPTAAPAKVADTSDQPKHGGVLRWALNLNCKTLDPAYAQSTCYKDFSHANFNSVLDTDDQFRIQPELVRSWSIDESGKTITFNIVQGARFHDGSNVTAQAIHKPDTIRRNLVKQVTAMVRWRESIIQMKKNGVDRVVEIGSGKVLAGLIRRIDKEIETTSISEPASVESFLKSL